MAKPIQITINVEEVVAEVYSRLTQKQGISQSAYGRRLILQDLKAKGLLPEGILMNILGAGSDRM